MNCPYCNKEIADDAVFCTECGKAMQQNKSGSVFCSSCGEKLSTDVAFCTRCGARVIEYSESTAKMQSSVSSGSAPVNVTSDNVSSENSVNYAYNTAQPDSKKNQGKEPLYIAITVLSTVFVFVLFKFVIFNKETPKEDDYAQTIQNEYVDETTEMRNTQEIDVENVENTEETVDYDFTQDSYASVDGYLTGGGEAPFAIQLDQDYSIYIKEENTGVSALLEINYVYIDESKLLEGVLVDSAGTEITVVGNVYALSGKAWIVAEECFDKNGNNLLEAFSEKKNLVEADYILPQSDTVLLKKKDIKNLSLQELCYARNEIYARHGRLFQSKELQEYFDSREWYAGSIQPDDFQESMLSDIERKNAVFLREYEYSIEPKGYQLD